MKKKELRKLASQIAEAELILQKTIDPKEIRMIKENIMKLDELIQNEIKEKSS